MTIKKDDLGIQEFLKLKKLGYFNSPTEYVEYSKDSLDRVIETNHAEGYLVYLDIYDKFKLVPIVWGNVVCYKNLLPNHFENNVPYMIDVRLDETKPFTLCPEMYYTRLKVNNFNKSNLKPIAITSFWHGVTLDDLKNVSDLFGGVPIITDRVKVMEEFIKVGNDKV